MILRYFDVELVMQLLDKINLQNREREAIINVDIQGSTEQEYADNMLVAIDTIHKRRMSAYKKIKEGLSNSNLARIILKDATIKATN